MSTRPMIHADETVNARIQRALGPSQLGDVVVDNAAAPVGALHDPRGISQRGNEEADAFLQRGVDPAPHAPLVELRRLLDDRVEADRLRGDPPNPAQALPEFMPVGIDEG